MAPRSKGAGSEAAPRSPGKARASGAGGQTAAPRSPSLKRPPANGERPTRAGEATAALSESAIVRALPSAAPVDSAPMVNPGLTRRQLLDLFFYMLLTRRVEERLVGLKRQGKVIGGLYRSLGQEATAVGSAYALESGDLMAPLIRDLGAVLVRGYTPRDVFAQFMGRATGPTMGRDCVLHMGELGGRGVISSIAMLGELVPVLAGCALAFKRMGRGRICLTWIGDGGVSTGAYHEGLNFAAVQGLPLVLIIENNGHAYSTPVAKQTAQPDFSRRGPLYGIPGRTVDGNDVLAVYAATRQAVSRARGGGGPSVIEARTFRMKGHAEHDDASYVPKELLEEWSRKDPIARFTAFLKEAGECEERDIRAIEAGIEAQLDEDLRWAEQSPEPPPESALAGVYADDTPFRIPPYPAGERS